MGSEAKCEAIVIDMKIIFYSHANKTYFHKKGFALSLILKVRVLQTRKWHTDYQNISSFRGKQKQKIHKNIIYELDFNYFVRKRF